MAFRPTLADGVASADYPLCYTTHYPVARKNAMFRKNKFLSLSDGEAREARGRGVMDGILPAHEEDLKGACERLSMSYYEEAEEQAQIRAQSYL